MPVGLLPGNGGYGVFKIIVGIIGLVVGLSFVDAGGMGAAAQGEDWTKHVAAVSAIFAGFYMMNKHGAIPVASYAAVGLIFAGFGFYLGALVLPNMS